MIYKRKYNREWSCTNIIFGQEPASSGAVCFLLQITWVELSSQNMPLPSGDVFYKRQLWVYNFGKTDESKFYMYDEITAKKECNEVDSLLLHYIENFFLPTVLELYLFPDNCFSQNKNFVLVHFLHTFINTTARNIRWNQDTVFCPVMDHSA